MLPLAARALALLATGAVAGLAINAVRPDGVRFASFAPPAACGAAGGAAEPAAAPAVEVLPPVEAVSLCGDPDALVADVRSAALFAEGHITNALHLPCAASLSTASAAVDGLADKHKLIVYGAGTEDALPVADEMRRRAARSDLRVVVVAGGFPAWNKAGLVCSSGPCLDCQAQHK